MSTYVFKSLTSSLSKSLRGVAATDVQEYMTSLIQIYCNCTFATSLFELT